MTKTPLCLFAVLLLFTGLECRKNPVIPGDTTFTITVEDVSCTDAYLKLFLAGGENIRSVTVRRNDSTIFSDLRLLTSDTLIVDEGLLPNKSYTYTMTWNGYTQSVRATTIDTTSHNWEFQTFTFGGEAGSSVLNDVAIINDSLAYAVGAIYLKDSTGNVDPNAYNLAKWDGNNWELLQIQFKTFCDQEDTGSYPAKAVFAFSANDVWISSGSQIVRWNGHTQTTAECIPVSVNEIWEENPNSVYVVGYRGGIAHYDSRNWTKIESGTDLPFIDIYGANDTKTNGQQILSLCCQNIPHQRGLFQIQGGTATELSTYPLEYDLTSIWFVPNKHYYLVGPGLFEKNTLSDHEWKKGEPGVVKYVLGKLRGNDVNDLFAVGAYGEVLHYNGVTWESFIDQTGVPYGGYGSVSVKGDLVIAVGTDSPMAVVTVGRKK